MISNESLLIQQLNNFDQISDSNATDAVIYPENVPAKRNYT